MGISKRIDSSGADGFIPRKIAFFIHREGFEQRAGEYRAQPSRQLGDACLFLLQQQAWMMASLLEYIAFERKLAPLAAAQPQKVVDAMTRDAGLALGVGRRLKQFLEYRHLAQRPPEMLVPDMILAEAVIWADRELLDETFPLLEKIFRGEPGDAR